MIYSINKQVSLSLSSFTSFSPYLWNLSEYSVFVTFKLLILEFCLSPELLSYKDPVAAAARKYKPIQSAVPGTTLGPIQIEAFLGGGVRTEYPI